jgi:hypothetical protein
LIQSNFPLITPRRYIDTILGLCDNFEAAPKEIHALRNELESCRRQVRALQQENAAINDLFVPAIETLNDRTEALQVITNLPWWKFFLVRRLAKKALL